MVHHPRKLALEPMVLAAICAYELGGLAGMWPTITTLSMRSPRLIRLVEVAAASWWAANHLEVFCVRARPHDRLR